MSLHLGAGSWFTFYWREVLIKTRAKFHVSLPNMFVNCIQSQSPVCDLWPRLIEEIMCHVLEKQGRESPQHQKETRLSTWPCFRMMAGLLGWLHDIPKEAPCSQSLEIFPCFDGNKANGLPELMAFWC